MARPTPAKKKPPLKAPAARVHSTFEKWFPHLIKKIVAVTFEDGATIKVDDDVEIRSYLECLDDERECAVLRKTGIDNPREVRLMREMQRKFEAMERASLPRKEVTKAELLADRDKWLGDGNLLRGWKTAACITFKITMKTLNKRLSGKSSG